MKKTHLLFFIFMLQTLSVFAQRKLPKNQIPSVEKKSTQTIQQSIKTDSLPPKKAIKNVIDSTTFNKSEKIKKEEKNGEKTNKKSFSSLFSKKNAKNTPDSVDIKKKNLSLSFLGLSKPKTAAVLAIIPGGGQIYNKKYWKAPIVWAALAGMGYLFKKDYDDYLKYRLEYVQRTENLHPVFGNVFNPTTAALPTETVKSYRDLSLSNAELSGFGLFLIYGLQGVEAFVDAHLASFDISDDLSMRIKPSIESTPTEPAAMGIGLAFSIGKQNRQQLSKRIEF